MAAAQPDLFGTALPAPPPGLAYAEAVIDTAEEAALLAQFEEVAVAPFRFQGWTGERLAPRPAAVRACHRYLACRPRDAPPAPSPARWLRPRRGAARRALDLSPQRRSAARLGTQHRADGRAALVGDLPEFVGEGVAGDRMIRIAGGRRSTI